MKVRYLMLVGAAAVSTAAARGEDSIADLQYEQSPALYDVLRLEEPVTFWERFNVSFDHHAPGVFEDQFSPVNYGNWNALWTDPEYNNLPDYSAGVARHAFSDAFGSSARDAALDLDLPIMEWVRGRQGIVADFLWNSFDGVEEQSVSPLDPSYRSVAHSWWNKQSEDGPFRYGVRPFRTSPYAYFGWRVRHGDRVWLLGDARYYCRNFRDQRCELALSAPIGRDLSLELGTSCQFGTNKPAKQMALKLLKTFKSGGNLNVALVAQQKPVMMASISLPW